MKHGIKEEGNLHFLFDMFFGMPKTFKWKLKSD